jgi:hypothetical protein
LSQSEPTSDVGREIDVSLRFDLLDD